MFSTIKDVILKRFENDSDYVKAFKFSLQKDWNEREKTYDLIKINLTGIQEIEEGNVFLGIEEKMERAQKSARENNTEGLFSNLHTVIEILLKDKLGIALIIEWAKLGKVIGICTKHGIFGEHTPMLKQWDEKVCKIDNLMKHGGYNPTSVEMNAALSVVTQGLRVLKPKIPTVTPQVMEEITDLLTGRNKSNQSSPNPVSTTPQIDVSVQS